MWDDIYEIASSAGNKFTLYLDDLTISGATVQGTTLWKIRQQLHKHGLKINKKKTRRIVHKPADVTGVMVTAEGLRLSNRQHEKLSKAKSNFSKPGGNRTKKANVLRGRKAQAGQIFDLLTLNVACAARGHSPINHAEAQSARRGWAVSRRTLRLRANIFRERGLRANVAVTIGLGAKHSMRIGCKSFPILRFTPDSALSEARKPHGTYAPSASYPVSTHRKPWIYDNIAFFL